MVWAAAATVRAPRRTHTDNSAFMTSPQRARARFPACSLPRRLPNGQLHRRGGKVVDDDAFVRCRLHARGPEQAAGASALIIERELYNRELVPRSILCGIRAE